MELKFYTGNYTLQIGQPFVILSAEARENDFFVEKFIIFESFDGQRVHANKYTYPKLHNRTLDDFIATETEVCKDDILHKIIYQHYQTQLQQLNYNVKVELLVSNPNLLSLLRDKFPKILDKIKTHTVNKELQELIELYQSIVVERIDINLDE